MREIEEVLKNMTENIRLDTSEKLAVIFNVCESIAWHVKWRNQRIFMCSDAEP